MALPLAQDTERPGIALTRTTDVQVQSLHFQKLRTQNSQLRAVNPASLSKLLPGYSTALSYDFPTGTARFNAPNNCS